MSPLHNRETEKVPRYEVMVKQEATNSAPIGIVLYSLGKAKDYGNHMFYVSTRVETD